MLTSLTKLNYMLFTKKQGLFINEKLKHHNKCNINGKRKKTFKFFIEGNLKLHFMFYLLKGFLFFKNALREGNQFTKMVQVHHTSENYIGLYMVFIWIKKYVKSIFRLMYVSCLVFLCKLYILKRTCCHAGFVRYFGIEPMYKTDYLQITWPDVPPKL